ncbi:hypothetical protein [Leucobacter sp.]
MKFSTVLLATGTGVLGYVLGAQAGRGRYREIRDRARKTWNSPALKKARKRTEKQLKRASRKLAG